MKKLLGILFVCMAISCSCGKKNSPGSVSNPPVNLTVSAVVNPDNSGNVAFTATAVNAVSYDFDFGNGVFQTVVAGVVTYRYLSSGNYTVNVIAKSASGETITKSLTISVNVVQALVWAEEFDVPGQPNGSKWGYDIGTGGGGWGNNELEYYTNRPENVTISGGTLKINAMRESYSGSAFTSARLLTKDKYAFKYGKLEVRAKLPAGVGTWPAIWMLGSNISTVPWPACGEIDVMEHRGSELNKIFATLHHPNHSGSNGDGGTVMIPNVTTAFHKYTTEWSPAALKFYVDDVLFYTFNNSAALPFNQNFFIILNLAIGGNFAGAVDPAFSNGTLEVDYVRVYQY